MKASKNTTRAERRAARRALRRSVDRIRWADTPPWWRTPLAGGVLAAVTIVGVGAFTAHRAYADPELGPPVHRVVRGDTLWAISRDAGLSVDALLSLPGNERYRQNPNLIEIGDIVALPIQRINEMAPAKVDVARWFDERETCTNGRTTWECLTWRSVVAYLYDAGFRGDDLVTMAAITPCESNRDPWRPNETHTDRDLANGWLGSYGLWQVRALVSDTGTGAPRDRDALMSSISHQAAAVYAIYQGGLENEKANKTIVPAKMPNGSPQAKRKYNRFDPWTCAQIHAHEPFLDVAHQAAREIGVIA